MGRTQAKTAHAELVRRIAEAIGIREEDVTNRTLVPLHVFTGFRSWGRERGFISQRCDMTWRTGMTVEGTLYFCKRKNE